MTRPSIRGGVALAVGVPVLVMAACSPQSTEPPAVEPDTIRALDIVEGKQDEPIELAVDGGADGVKVTHRSITLAPGVGTGRHCHHGQLVVVVEQGELTHYADAYHGGVRVYRAGESVVEGSRYIHETVNEGSEDLVVMVTHFTPEGMPTEETDLSKCEQ